MGPSLTQSDPGRPGYAPDHRRRSHGTHRPAHPKQLTDALLFLAGYAPDVLDSVTEAVEPCVGDGSEDPAPFCAICGGDIGVFLKLGLDWRHYRGTDLSDIELVEPGHKPVLAWRSPGLPG